MKIKNRLAAYAALTALACGSATGFADDHAYTEGQVVNVARIRTVDGKFDDYMKWVDTTWKAQQEAAKKAGALCASVDTVLEAIALASFVDGLAVHMLFLKPNETRRVKAGLVRQYLERSLAVE